MTLTNSVITSDTTGNGGPGGDMINHNAGKRGSGGYGGGIYSLGATATVINTTIQGNNTGDGAVGGNVTDGTGNGGNGGSGGLGGVSSAI